ncbi:CoA transferase [Rhodococcus sp. 14-2686-1-2]|nr:MULTISPECIES: CoA transferase [unclassified Rhodococcus (in: high G+C Gram-positive bacteria)]OZE93163.1 CoA transferase [Rhodococcus sp. 15-1189-1-1a]OZF08281.1 CoA transferase [Rhodococcus sp. 14-2686-1-2]
MSSYSLLQGVRILEVAQLAPSSVGGHLADLGAEVIKVESGSMGDPVRVGGARAVGSPNGASFMHLRWNRGKRSVSLDLKTESGRRAFLDIARSCDAVIEGMRGGYLDWLSVGYDALVRENPQIVLCSVSGMGSEGPYRGLGTGGPVFDAFGGIREVEVPENPPTTGIAGSTTPPIAMYAIGAYGAMGLLAALQKAKATQRPVRIEISGIDIAAAWMPDGTDAELNRERSQPRPTWLPDGRLPDWPRLEAYTTADGESMLLGAHVHKFWANFCQATGREDLLDIDLQSVDSGAAERADTVWHALKQLFASRTRAEWMQLFLDNDIAGGPVNNTTDLVADPHFLSRTSTYDVEHPVAGELRFVVSPVRVDGEAFAPALPPEVGADTSSVLRSICGYNDERVDAVLDMTTASGVSS